MLYDVIDNDIVNEEAKGINFPDAIRRLTLAAFAGPRVFCGCNAVHGRGWAISPHPVINQF